MIPTEEIAACFTRPDGSYRFARWGRALAPVVFGVEESSLGVMRAGFEAIAALSGIGLLDTDPELGSNVMVFFCREWAELAEVPNLDQLVPDLHPLIARLEAGDAHHYRLFRFDSDGAIRACFVFLRATGVVAQMPAEQIALSEAVQVILLWSDQAFAARSPLALTSDGHAVLRPEVAGIIRAAYDPVLPAVAEDASHAMRLSARLGMSGLEEAGLEEAEEP